MIRGKVDELGRVLIEIEVGALDGAKRKCEAWVDTGFTGFLTLPQSIIETIGLERSGSADVVLADGSEVCLKVYSCEVNWFGRDCILDVIGNTGEFALLGYGLLNGRRLSIDYARRKVELD